MITYDYWKEQSWASERDQSLEFEADILKEALALWCAHAEPGAIPRRNALTSRAMKPFLGNAIISERQNDGRYRLQLMGSRISLMIGDMEGHLLDDCLPSDALRRWSDAFDQALTQLHPFRFVSSVAILDLRFLRAEILLAPLLDEEGLPAIVLGVATFKSDTCGKREAVTAAVA